jgi:LmbE family N-acetylglucosaminyl deacetylase
MIEKVNTILFSPHSDDIAYSLGGTLLLDYFENPLMVTVFTRSTFSPRIKLSSEAEITSKRKKEDEAFAETVGLSLKTLHFPEPPLRGLDTNEKIFTSKATSDPIFEEVYDAIYDIISSFPGTLVVSPLALGNHIDHQIVLLSCIKACEDLGNPILFYEDLPYVSGFTFKQIRKHVEIIDSNLSPIKLDITSFFEDKLTNLSLYSTQIGKTIPSGVYSHSMRFSYNKGVVDKIWQYDLFKLIFSLFSRMNKGKRYERLWK